MQVFAKTSGTTFRAHIDTWYREGMRVQTKALLIGLAAVAAFFGLGLGVGWLITKQVDHNIGWILLIVVPAYQIVLAPFLYLGVRSIAAKNSAFSHTSYSHDRVSIGGQDHVVSRATGSSNIVISTRTGAIMTAVALGIFTIASVLLYIFRNSIG